MFYVKAELLSDKDGSVYENSVKNKHYTKMSLHSQLLFQLYL